MSNPPYVAAADPALHALRYEPAVALTPGASGLEALRADCSRRTAHLLPGGWLVLEHGASRPPSWHTRLWARAMLAYAATAIWPAIDRVTEAQWP